MKIRLKKKRVNAFHRISLSSKLSSQKKITNIYLLSLYLEICNIFLLPSSIIHHPSSLFHHPSSIILPCASRKNSSRVPRYQNPLKVDGFCDFQVKPLPWRGHRGLGYRSKPLLMKKGMGLMEDIYFYCLLLGLTNTVEGSYAFKP